MNYIYIYMYIYIYIYIYMYVCVCMYVYNLNKYTIKTNIIYLLTHLIKKAYVYGGRKLAYL